MNWLKNIALICFTSLVAIAAAELALRFFQSRNDVAVESRKIAGLPLHDFEHHFCFGPRDHQKFVPEVVSREYENQQYFEFRNQSVALHTYDEKGFRVSGDLGASENGVIVVGDSFVRGTLADDTETIPAVLNRWYPKTAFYNFGIGGHGPKQYLKTYQTYQAEYEHELVVLILYLGNDAQNDLDFENRLARAEKIHNQQVQGQPSFVTQLKINVAAFLDKLAVGDLLVKSYRSVKTGRAAAGANGNALPSADELAEQMLSSVAEFTENVERLNKDVLIVSIPSREYFDDEKFPTWQNEYAIETSDRISMELDNYVKANGLKPVVHLLPMLQEEFAQGEAIEKIYGWPDAHFTEYGYFLSARQISNALERSLGFPQIVPPEFVNTTDYDPANLACP